MAALPLIDSASTATLIPVLAVADPETAKAALRRHFGFEPAGKGRIKLGSQHIAVVPTGNLPEGMVSLRLDHVALAVADADAVQSTFAERGAELHRSFTPDGPRDIAEFWRDGVRFVFFQAPDGWPLEFCTRNGRGAMAADFGHDHYAIRSPDIAAVERDLAKAGVVPLARHCLAGANGPVNVAFLKLGATVFELFDEAPFAAHGTRDGGWVGLIAAP